VLMIRTVKRRLDKRMVRETSADFPTEYVAKEARKINPQVDIRHGKYNEISGGRKYFRSIYFISSEKVSPDSMGVRCLCSILFDLISCLGFKTYSLWHNLLCV
jgi:hypothetical protein